MQPDGILISPGPGTPDDAGVSNDLLATLSGEVPIFGVCLGMQCIGQAFGAEVIRAPEVMHGKTSVIKHDATGVFESLPNPLTATRYHSLIVERSSVPPELEVTATCDGGLVMGLRHRRHPTEGVQFHPESVLTDAGHQPARQLRGPLPVGGPYPKLVWELASTVSPSSAGSPPAPAPVWSSPSVSPLSLSTGSVSGWPESNSGGSPTTTSTGVPGATSRLGGGVWARMRPTSEDPGSTGSNVTACRW